VRVNAMLSAAVVILAASLASSSLGTPVFNEEIASSETTSAASPGNRLWYRKPGEIWYFHVSVAEAGRTRQSNNLTPAINSTSLLAMATRA